MSWALALGWRGGRASADSESCRDRRSVQSWPLSVALGSSKRMVSIVSPSQGGGMRGRNIGGKQPSDPGPPGRPPGRDTPGGPNTAESKYRLVGVEEDARREHLVTALPWRGPACGKGMQGRGTWGAMAALFPRVLLRCISLHIRLHFQLESLEADVILTRKRFFQAGIYFYMALGRRMGNITSSCLFSSFRGDGRWKGF